MTFTARIEMDNAAFEGDEPPHGYYMASCVMHHYRAVETCLESVAAAMRQGVAYGEAKPC